MDPSRLHACWTAMAEGLSLGRQCGQGLADYALILALIAIIAIVALVFPGSQGSTILHKVGTSV